MTTSVARVSAGKLLLAERATNAALLADVNSNIDGATAEVSRRDDSNKATLLALILLWSQRMATDVRKTLADRRAATRAVSYERLRVEARAAGVTLPDAILTLRSVEDDARAHMAADSLAQQWRTTASHSAMKAVRQEDDIADAIADTRETMPYRVARTAATEAAQAYNDEHRRAIDNAMADDPSLTQAIAAAQLVRIWDASLDKRTCSRCRDLDGSTAPMGGSFPSGEEPGELHILCRCVEVLHSVV